MLDSKYCRDRQSQIAQHASLALSVYGANLFFWLCYLLESWGSDGWEVAVFGGTTGEYAECYAPNLNSCHSQNYKRCLNYANIDWALSPRQSRWRFAMVSDILLIPLLSSSSPLALPFLLFSRLYYTLVTQSRTWVPSTWTSQFCKVVLVTSTPGESDITCAANTSEWVNCQVHRLLTYPWYFHTSR